MLCTNLQLACAVRGLLSTAARCRRAHRRAQEQGRAGHQPGQAVRR